MASHTRHSPLNQEGQFTPRPREIHHAFAKRVWLRWLRGHTASDIARDEGMTVDEIRRMIKAHIKVLVCTTFKWKRAEARCHALAMELNLLRIGKEAPPDQPIETLNVPDFWLKPLKGAGIDTVNQLRSIDAEMLLTRDRFPSGAVDWAVMKLDKLGLSHRLAHSRPKRRSPKQTPGRKVLR